EVSVRENQDLRDENNQPVVTCNNGWCEVGDHGKNYPETQVVEAWRKAGQGFIGLGGGVMYAIAPNHGPMFELKLSYLFPTTNIVISPTLGYGYGF
ncbi:MAG: hypothetical protein FWD57_00710, partial [Polyangiaceae bacterium]|nr:hypothetical protein [Polyangiaceae bacterium]